MSRDGYLPPGVEDWHIPGNRPQDIHAEACPQHEDSPEFCVCGCEDSHHNASGLCDCQNKCDCEGWKHDENPDCICDDLSDGGMPDTWED